MKENHSAGRRNLPQVWDLDDSLIIGAVAVGPLPNDFIR